MPNVDFERRLFSKRLASSMNAPDFKRKLRQVKAKLDYEDQDILRVDFSDTFRPELWCLEGLARQLEPLPGRQYDLTLVENLPKVPVHFLHIPQGKSAWVLSVQVDAHHEIVDDSYFLKKVRDQIGFSSRQNIDVSITPKEFPTMNRGTTISIDPVGDDENETLAPLSLTAGINTVVITTCDQRIGAWLLFTFLCNYLDRGHKPLGFASSVGEKDLFARWNPFMVSNQYIVDTFGFQPDIERFSTVLQSQHYQTHYDAASQIWYISPPIFRFDIIHPIDILEDYLVVTGYDFGEIQPRVLSRADAKELLKDASQAPLRGPTKELKRAPQAPLRGPTNMGSQTKRSVLEERLVNYMQAYGARQTVGLLLDSYENLVEHMCHDAPERLIHLVNAANKNREYAVDSSLVPLLRNAVHPSAPLPPSTFFLFTETLFIESVGAGVERRDASLPPSVGELASARIAHSRWKMGILLVGTDHPFNNAHTLLDALCYHLRLDYTLKRNDHHALISGRQMTAFVADTPIGQFGEVHPEVLTRWELFYPTSFVELDLDSITELWGGNKA